MRPQLNTWESLSLRKAPVPLRQDRWAFAPTGIYCLIPVTILPLEASRPSYLGRRRATLVRRVAAGGCLCLLLSLIAAVQTTRAQMDQNDQKPAGSLTQLSLEQLGDVEVTTVSKDPQQVQKTPAAVFVITQEDIRRSGATSIPEALRLAPGVEVARIDGNHWSVAIRGFAGQFSKSLLVLVDGRSIYTPLFEGVYWDLPYVMLEDVERIEVIRGPGGTIWGSNAVNGVINIITKSANNTHGALATLGSGTVDQGTGAFRYGGSTWEGFRLSHLRYGWHSRAGISLRR